MDGNYRNTLDLRLPAADTVIFISPSRFICFYRIIKRRLKSNRVDNPKKCKERLTFELIKWVLWKFPQENKTEILEKLKKYKNDQTKAVHILKSKKDLLNFWRSLKY